MDTSFRSAPTSITSAWTTMVRRPVRSTRPTTRAGPTATVDRNRVWMSEATMFSDSPGPHREPRGTALDQRRHQSPVEAAVRIGHLGPKRHLDRRPALGIVDAHHLERSQHVPRDMSHDRLARPAGVGHLVRGRPRPRWAMMLRWISLVPA